MNQALKVQFSITKEDREYTFTFPYGAPNGEINDILFSMRSELISIMQSALAKEGEKDVVSQ